MMFQNPFSFSFLMHEKLHDIVNNFHMLKRINVIVKLSYAPNFQEKQDFLMLMRFHNVATAFTRPQEMQGYIHQREI
jgi:hypothetical protein